MKLEHIWIGFLLVLLVGGTVTIIIFSPELEIPRFENFVSINLDIEAEKTPQESILCVDSDGGLSYLVRGITDSTTKEGLIINSYEDYCISPIKLEEYYCNSAFELVFPDSKVYSCPYGCNNGKCLNKPEIDKGPINSDSNNLVEGGGEECVDSDGNNVFLRGSVSDFDESGGAIKFTDYCIGGQSGQYGLEWTCHVNSVEHNFFKCEHACLEGACISAEPREYFENFLSSLTKNKEEEISSLIFSSRRSRKLGKDLDVLCEALKHELINGGGYQNLHGAIGSCYGYNAFYSGKPIDACLTFEGFAGIDASIIREDCLNSFKEAEYFDSSSVPHISEFSFFSYDANGYSVDRIREAPPGTEFGVHGVVVLVPEIHYVRLHYGAKPAKLNQSNFFEFDESKKTITIKLRPSVNHGFPINSFYCDNTRECLFKLELFDEEMKLLDSKENVLAIKSEGEEFECVDFDNGADYYKKALTVGYDGDSIVVREDFCQTELYSDGEFESASEWSCWTNEETGEQFIVNSSSKCINGCQDGACIK